MLGALAASCATVSCAFAADALLAAQRVWQSCPMRQADSADVPKVLTITKNYKRMLSLLTVIEEAPTAASSTRVISGLRACRRSQRRKPGIYWANATIIMCF